MSNKAEQKWKWEGRGKYKFWEDENWLKLSPQDRAFMEYSAGVFSEFNFEKTPYYRDWKDCPGTVFLQGKCNGEIFWQLFLSDAVKFADLLVFPSFRLKVVFLLAKMWLDRCAFNSTVEEKELTSIYNKNNDAFKWDISQDEAKWVKVMKARVDKDELKFQKLREENEQENQYGFNIGDITWFTNKATTKPTRGHQMYFDFADEEEMEAEYRKEMDDIFKPIEIPSEKQIDKMLKDILSGGNGGL